MIIRPNIYKIAFNNFHTIRRKREEYIIFGQTLKLTLQKNKLLLFYNIFVNAYITPYYKIFKKLLSSLQNLREHFSHKVLNRRFCSFFECGTIYANLDRPDYKFYESVDFTVFFVQKNKQYI